MGEVKTYVTYLNGGEVLSRPVYSSSGQLVLPKGTALTYSQIVRMKQLAVGVVWIEVPETLPFSLSKVQAETARAYEKTVACMVDMFENAKQNQTVDLEESQRALEELAVACQSEKNFLNLVVNLKTFDEYTYQHSVGVGLLSRRLAEWMGLTEQQCQEIFLAATLHDIGKSRLDQNILNKPGKLTAEEYEHVKQHAYFGYEILRRSGLPEHLAAPAYNHHERMNGKGYPRKLVGDEIDLYSRIVSVADVFNAMTSRRVYHDPLSYYRVLDELQRNAFGELDPSIVSLFATKMTAFLVGNVVTLNDGTEGTVVLVPADRPTRPLLQTKDGFLDLMHRPQLYIESVQAV